MSRRDDKGFLSKTKPYPDPERLTQNCTEKNLDSAESGIPKNRRKHPEAAVLPDEFVVGVFVVAITSNVIIVRDIVVVAADRGALEFDVVAVIEPHRFVAL